MLIFVIFTLNAYVTGETSLDPLDHIEIDEAKNANEDVRNKRSGEFFSLLLKKKLGLLNSLTGVSSGKSIGGHPGVNPFDQHLHPFQHLQPPQPLVSFVLQTRVNARNYEWRFCNCVSKKNINRDYS